MRSRSNSQAFVTIGLAFAVGVFVWFARSLHDLFAPTGADVVLPTFVGQNESDAVRQASDQRLQAIVIARRPSERYPMGIVLSQQPEPRVRVRAGRRVELVVSSGEQTVTLPDLRYRSLRESSYLLSRLRLRVGKTRRVTADDVDTGLVVEESPAPLTRVREGTHIDLALSRGVPPSLAAPDFIGLQVDDARRLAQASRVRLGQIVWTPFGANGPPRGVVVRQRPVSGKVIDPRQPISLQASAGPEQFGYLVREVHVAVTVPPTETSAHLRVVADDALGAHPVYDAFAQPGQRLDLTTTTVGVAELDTYLNDDLIDRTVVGHEPPIFKEHTYHGSQSPSQ